MMGKDEGPGISFHGFTFSVLTSVLATVTVLKIAKDQLNIYIVLAVPTDVVLSNAELSNP